MGCCWMDGSSQKVGTVDCGWDGGRGCGAEPGRSSSGLAGQFVGGPDAGDSEVAGFMSW